MQNKINQKVPIAKMDELIAAIRESGGGDGGSGKLYQHKINISFTTSGKSGTGTVVIYNKSPDVITDLTANYIVNSLSIIYPRVYIYNSFFDIINIVGNGYAIGFQEKDDYSVTHSQLTYTINRDAVTEF
jgi:hypothetical protein